ncbi:MAG: hypothetical protein ACYTFI_16505 [Planctomycetota bacterium]|jgi:hypothetical protein
MAGKKSRPKSRATGKGRSKKKRKKKAKAPAPQFPRLAWSRSPVQKPHSTKKGARGYDRKRAKKQTRREVEGS